MLHMYVCACVYVHTLVCKCIMQAYVENKNLYHGCIAIHKSKEETFIVLLSPQNRYILKIQISLTIPPV